MTRGKSWSPQWAASVHDHPGENEFTAPDLNALMTDQWADGCLSEKADGKAPHFGFSAADRAALRAFATTDRQSLHRHDPKELPNANACAEPQRMSLNWKVF